MTLRDPLAFLLLGLLANAVACSSSSDFRVAAEDSGSDTNDGGVDTAPSNDGGADTAVDPCASDPGEARFCVSIDTDKVHPGYDAISGAETLKIDGSGVVFVFMYDKDPNTIGPTEVVTPVVLQYPPKEKIGAEVKVADMPVTIAGSAPEKDYWIVASFEDNTADAAKRGAGEAQLLAGDFVFIPKLNADSKYDWPKVTLKRGTTQKLSLQLKPYRFVSVDLTTSSDFTTKYPKTTYGINGDGPAIFAIYDGTLGSGSETVLDFDSVKCVKMDPYAFTPPVLKLGFGTVLDGSHKLLVAVLDYEGKPFPGNGTLMTPIDSTAPMVNISTSSWISSAGLVRLTTVSKPYAVGERVDPLTCP